MTNPSQAQVLIIGAGPTGLTAALELTRHGVPVRIVEKRVSRGQYSKALGIHSRTLEVLERLGVLEEMLGRGRTVDSVHLYVRSEPVGKIALDALDAPYPLLLLLEQSETERILEARLEALGVQVERGTELTGLSQDPAGVQATLRSPRGDAEILEVAYLVGADGPRSTVRGALGISFPGRAVPGHFALADVQIEWTGPRPDFEHDMHAYTGPELIFGMFPDGRHYRVVTSLPPDVASGERGVTTNEVVTGAEKLLAAIQRRVDGHGLGARLHSPLWTSSYRVSTRLAERLSKGRVFLIGDAAHIHSPVGGQGMNAGMQDALNLAWKLGAVLRGWADEALLESYEAERLPLLRPLVEGTERLTDVINSDHRALTGLLRAVLPGALRLAGVQRSLRDQFSAQNLNYRHSPLLEKDRSAGLSKGQRWPGDRAPDVAGLRSGAGDSRRVFELLREGPQFHLFALRGFTPDAARLESLRCAAARVARRFPESVRVHQVRPGPGVRAGELLDPAGELHRRYGAGQGRLVLLRPDGYLSFIGGPLEGSELLSHLRDRLSLLR